MDGLGDCLLLNLGLGLLSECGGEGILESFWRMFDVGYKWCEGGRTIAAIWLLNKREVES
jgi:hypothetical protein